MRSGYLLTILIAMLAYAAFFLLKLANLLIDLLDVRHRTMNIA